MKCSNCKFDNQGDVLVCEKCGYPMNLKEKWGLTYQMLLSILGVTLAFVGISHILISIIYL
ncbi:MAG: hypothetical protein GY817_00440 [bacterium]|nr:hypothetical protein [bacterium]